MIVFASYTELDEEIVERQVALVYELLCQGELGLARLLRRKVLEKCEKKKAAQDQPPPVNPVQNIDLSSRSDTGLGGGGGSDGSGGGSGGGGNGGSGSDGSGSDGGGSDDGGSGGGGSGGGNEGGGNGGSEGGGGCSGGGEG